jgi:molybdopterin converting factor small subunit
MAEVVLPASLVQLFPGSPKRVQVEGRSVQAVIDGLDQRWPGMRNRLCAPGPAIRQHIRIFVDSEQSSLETPVAATSEVRIIPALSGG